MNFWFPVASLSSLIGLKRVTLCPNSASFIATSDVMKRREPCRPHRRRMLAGWDREGRRRRRMRGRSRGRRGEDSILNFCFRHADLE